MAITAAKAMVRHTIRRPWLSDSVSQITQPPLVWDYTFICRDWSRLEGGIVMRNFYLRNPHGFDRWLKANAILGSLLAIGMLAMALAGLNPAARSDGATELSSVTSLK
jgi:hypothetical protein